MFKFTKKKHFQLFGIKRWKQTFIISSPLSGRVTEPAVSNENCIYRGAFWEQFKWTLSRVINEELFGASIHWNEKRNVLAKTILKLNVLRVASNGLRRECSLSVNGLPCIIRVPAAFVLTQVRYTTECWECAPFSKDPFLQSSAHL